MKDTSKTAVLTNPLNARLYQKIFGPNARYLREWKESFPVASTLHNLAADGALRVIIEEAHFPHAGLFAQELATYFDMGHRSVHEPRVIAVCPQRRPGDALLAYLACYLDVYDIVCDCTLTTLATRLAQVVEHPCSRKDVLGIIGGLADFDAPPWSMLGTAQATSTAAGVSPVASERELKLTVCVHIDGVEDARVTVA